jgi:SAM-dependent methyltransferase
MTEATGHSRPELQPLRAGLRAQLAAAVAAFVRANLAICQAITPRHLGDGSAFAQFRAALLGSVLDLAPRTVVDIGAGRTWHAHPALKDLAGFKLVGVDIELEEMARNADLDERVVSDVTKSIPLPTGSADLVTVRSGVEHFSDTEAFLRNLHALLRPGGRALLVFPGPYAPFVLINRMLPRKAARSLLRLLVPGSEGVLGFKAHYDRTSYRRFSRLAERTGFNILRCSCSYYSSTYFRFFLPLYVLSLLLDHVRHALAIKSLASFHFFMLEKPQGGARESSTPREGR